MLFGGFRSCGSAFRLFQVARSTQPLSRPFSAGPKQGPNSTVYYVAAAGVLTLGLSYAAVPLYRMFCQFLNQEPVKTIL